MTRTSFSLPLRLQQMLSLEAQKTGLSKQLLVLRCLKRMKKNPKKLRIINRDTIKYNQVKCSAKIYLRLPESVHNYVQTMRISEKISVSYLVALAIEQYLSKIVTLLLSKSKRKIIYFHRLDTIFTLIYRRFTTDNPGLSIVMLR